jgi:hypothetical protein
VYNFPNMAVERPVIDRPVNAERQPSPETSRFNETFAALHPLLLALPNGLTGPVTRESLGNIANRNYSLFESRSMDIRERLWAGRGDFQTKMGIWLPDTIKKFQDAKDFFNRSDRGRHWAVVLDRLDINARDFKEEDALQLYQKYLSGNRSGEKSSQFVQDLISSDDFSLADREAITWIGAIFGTEEDPARKEEIAGADETIFHHAYAEKRFQQDPDDMVRLANVRIQLPNGQEGLRSEVFHRDEIRVIKFYAQNQQGQLRNQPDRTNQPAVVPAPVDGQPEQTPVNLQAVGETSEPTTTAGATAAQPAIPAQPRRVAPQARPTARPVDAARPVAQPELITQEQMQNDPEGLLGLVNRRLEATQARERVLQTEPQALADFFRTLEFPNVNRIDRAQAQFVDGNLVLRTELEAVGEFEVLGRTIQRIVHPQIEVVIASDPASGELRVIAQPQIGNVNFIERGKIRGIIEPYLRNLNATLLERINQLINPEWGITGIDLLDRDNKLNFKFQKRPTQA